MGRIGNAYGDSVGPRPVDLAIRKLADRQHGVVAHWQLIELGLTRQAIWRRCGKGTLIRIHPGVYAVGHTALTVESRYLSAVLACGRDAVLSHRSAADLHGLLSTSSPRIEVTAPRGRRSHQRILVHRSRVLAREDRTSVDRIPVTSVARTLIDLADVASDAQVAQAVRQADLLRTFDLAAVERSVARVSNRRGRGRLTRALALYRPEPAFTRSNGERRALALCRDHGLTQPQANVWVAGHEVDLYWPDARLAVEFDGRATHGTTAAFVEDRRRDRRFAAEGIQVLRVTAFDLRDEAALARELRSIRRQRLSRRRP